MALLESSGRPLMQASTEVGNWRAVIHGGTARSATRGEARRYLFAYIESDYHRRRVHSARGYRTPEQAERNMA